MFILRISLLFLLLCLVLNVKVESVQGNERDGNEVLFLVGDFTGQPSDGISIKRDFYQKKSRNEVQLRTIGSLLFRPFSDAPLTPIAPIAADPLQDPVVANNEANRIFLNALIMALQQPSTSDSATPVWENHSADEQQLTRVQQDQNNMIDEKVTREFIIGFIKGVQTGNDNTINDNAVTINNRIA